jgi:hypothetical protein
MNPRDSTDTQSFYGTGFGMLVPDPPPATESNSLTAPAVQPRDENQDGFHDPLTTPVATTQNRSRNQRFQGHQVDPTSLGFDISLRGGRHRGGRPPSQARIGRTGGQNQFNRINTTRNRFQAICLVTT